MTADLIALAAEIERGHGMDNDLDVLIEIAMFEPDGEFVSVRANAAGTKVIYTRPDGSPETFWAEEWTKDRNVASAALRARARCTGAI